MKPAEPKFPARAMAKAQKIAAHSELFNAAADSLKQSVSDKNAKTEKFWRQVFGAYAHLIVKRGADDTTWHLMNTAAGYAQNFMTPGEVTPQAPPGTPERATRPLPKTDDSDLPF